MAKRFKRFGVILASVILVGTIIAIACPAEAQQRSTVNPTADAVNEQQLLQQFKTIKGLGTIPDTKSYVLEHPAGREWREFHTVWLNGSEASLFSACLRC